MELPQPKIKRKTSVLLFGASKSGKTSMLLKMLMHKDELFEDPPDLIVFAYTVYDEQFKILSTLPNTRVLYHQGVPNVESIAEINARSKLVVFDDMFGEIDKRIVNWFLIYCNHLNNGRGACCMLAVQDMANPSPWVKLCRRNTDLFVLMDSPSDRTTLQTLSTRIFQNKQFLLDCMKDQKRHKVQYPYLLVDTSPRTEDRLRCCTDIFNPAGCTIYTPPN